MKSLIHYDKKTKKCLCAIHFSDNNKYPITDIVIDKKPKYYSGSFEYLGVFILYLAYFLLLF